MALQSSASEWEVGKSDPKEFTADAVVEVVQVSDKSETERIGMAERYNEGDERDTVIKAVDARFASFPSDGDDGNTEDEKEEGGDDSGPGLDNPKYNSFNDPTTGEDSPNPSKADADTESEKSDDDYNPYQDGKIGSSSLAEKVAQELAGLGTSPTRDACHKAYDTAHKSQD